jgi:hypothetical protein
MNRKATLAVYSSLGLVLTISFSILHYKSNRDMSYSSNKPGRSTSSLLSHLGGSSSLQSRNGSEAAHLLRNQLEKDEKQLGSITQKLQTLTSEKNNLEQQKASISQTILQKQAAMKWLKDLPEFPKDPSARESLFELAELVYESENKLPSEMRLGKINIKEDVAVLHIPGERLFRMSSDLDQFRGSTLRHLGDLLASIQTKLKLQKMTIYQVGQTGPDSLATKRMERLYSYIVNNYRDSVESIELKTVKRGQVGFSHLLLEITPVKATVL